MENTATSRIFKDPQGRPLTVHSPDGSIPSEQELDQMFQAKYGQTSQPSQGVEGDFVQKSMKNANLDPNLLGSLNKIPAVEHEVIRSIGSDKNMGDVVENAYRNPEQSPSFKSQINQNVQEALPKNMDVYNRTQAGMIPSAIGEGADLLTNPVAALSILGMEGLGKAISPIKYKGLTMGERASELPVQNMMASQEGQVAGAEANKSKAFDKLVALIQPNKARLNARPNDLPEISESLPVVQKSKDYGELSNILKEGSLGPMKQRSKIYAEKSANPDTSHMTPANDLLTESYKDPKTDPKDLKAMQTIYDREQVNTQKATPEQLSDSDWLQKQKSDYQTKAKPLYNKRDAGTLTGNESASLNMYERLAKGYELKLENLDPNLERLNQQFAGRTTASKLATNMQTEQRLHPESRFVDQLVDVIESGKTSKLGAARGILSKIPGLSRFAGRTVEGETSGIANLMKGAENKQNVADLIQSIIESKKSPLPDTANLEYPNRLQLPPPLPSPEDMRTMDIRRGRFLPGGQGSGPTINVPGSSTIYQESGELPSTRGFNQPSNPLTYKPFANLQMPQKPPFRGQTEVNPVDRSYTSKGGGKGISKENLKRLARRGIK